MPHVPAPYPEDPARLLSRLRDGDESAFEAIFRTWYAPLVRFAMSIARDQARAEEVVQDAFLELWRQRVTITVSGTPQSWLFRVVRNRSLNVVRHDAIVARKTPGVVAAFGRAPSGDAQEVESGIAEAELNMAVEAAVQSLPPRCREVFLLSRRQGVRQADIAAQLGISLKAVEAHITRALRELRVSLAPHLRPPRT